jgi:menaquinone-dependent protoporphyrinogen oxidase
MWQEETMKPVLVAYATKYGSTREVAEAIAATLGEHGLPTEARPAREVSSLDGYSAVVLGGALYYFMWHRGARRFLSRHRTALATMPVAVFSMGPFGEDAPSELAEARKPMDRVLAKHPAVAPVSTAVFGGRLDPALLRFPDANPGMKAMPASDARDWDVIRAWAEALPGAFGLTGRET